MTYPDIISLSDAEASFLATLAAQGRDVFSTRDAYDVLGEGRRTRDSLERLVRKGWLERLEKGKYLIIPLEAGPDRRWTEDAFVIARYLVEPSAIAYWSALRHWNLTEQVPRVTYVQSPTRRESRRPVVLGMRFRIVRIKPERFFGLHRVHTGRHAVEVTDREKTLIDSLDRPELSGGIPTVARAIGELDGRLDWRRVTSYLRRFESGAVVKRLGFLVESLDLTHAPEREVIEEWQGLLTAGISQLDPSSGRPLHRIATRWRIAVNLPEPGLRGLG